MAVNRGALKVVIDRHRCSGHGRCYTLAPDVFAADAEGYGVVATPVVPPELEEDARMVARSCPERAIDLVE